MLKYICIFMIYYFVCSLVTVFVMWKKFHKKENKQQLRDDLKELSDSITKKEDIFTKEDSLVVFYLGGVFLGFVIVPMALTRKVLGLKLVSEGKYLVIEWQWLEDSLNDEELETLYDFLDRATFDKEEQRYYVIGEKEPRADEVAEILKNRYKKKQVKLPKQELLEKLNELSELEDSELAHMEAVEALLDYINDDVIIDAYLDVPLYEG